MDCCEVGAQRPSYHPHQLLQLYTQSKEQHCPAFLANIRLHPTKGENAITIAMQPNHSNPHPVSLPLKLDLERLRLDGFHNAIAVKLHIEGVRSPIVVDGRVRGIPRIFGLRERGLIVWHTLRQE